MNVPKKCSDWPLLTEAEVNEFLSKLPKWSLIKDISSVEGQIVLKLHIRFLTTNFVSAMDFIQRAGAVAEAQGHHPGIDQKLNHNNNGDVIINVFKSISKLWIINNLYLTRHNFRFPFDRLEQY